MSRGDGEDVSGPRGGGTSTKSAGQAANLVSGSGDRSAGRFGGVRPTDTTEQFWTLVSFQAGLMLLLVAALINLELLTPELYYTLSFLGLLALRTVFVPADDPPKWSRHLNWVVRVGFLVLGYLIFRQSLGLL